MIHFYIHSSQAIFLTKTFKLLLLFYTLVIIIVTVLQFIGHTLSRNTFQTRCNNVCSSLFPLLLWQFAECSYPFLVTIFVKIGFLPSSCGLHTSQIRDNVLFFLYLPFWDSVISRLGFSALLIEYSCKNWLYAYDFPALVLLIKKLLLRGAVCCF